MYILEGEVKKIFFFLVCVDLWNKDGPLHLSPILF